MSIGVMEDYKLRDLRASHTLGWLVYLQQIKKKAKAEGKTCHAKTMLSGLVGLFFQK
jgi:hypothetical protein